MTVSQYTRVVYLYQAIYIVDVQVSILALNPIGTLCDSHIDVLDHRGWGLIVVPFPKAVLPIADTILGTSFPQGY